MKAKIDENHFRVAIFGSARIKTGDGEYKLVQQLGKSLAEQDISIITGGGPGLMNAASEGHHAGRKNNQVHSLGLTIKLTKKYEKSFHLDVVKDFKRFSDRLDVFIKYSNVVVVAPGGVGTMLEFFYTWQLIQVKHACEVPVIMLGKTWEGLFNWIKKEPLSQKLLDKEDLSYIYLVDNDDDAMAIIKKAKLFHDQGKHICENVKIGRTVNRLATPLRSPPA